MVLRYIQSRKFYKIPALKRPNNKITIILQAKEALIRAHVFSKPPSFLAKEVRLVQNSAHSQITSKLIKKAFFCQSITKISGPISLTLKLLDFYRFRNLNKLQI